MKGLHEKVNIIPLIAKADCLTPNEIKKLKDRVSPRTAAPQRIQHVLLYAGCSLEPLFWFYLCVYV